MAYLIDMTRPSLDILVDLINQENPGSMLKPEWVTVASGYPKEVSYQGKDTHTVLAANKGSPLFGNTPFYYNRVWTYTPVANSSPFQMTPSIRHHSTSCRSYYSS